MAKVKEVLPTKQYETNRISEKFTIKLAWAYVKSYVAKHKTFTLNEVKNLVKQGICTVTPARSSASTVRELRTHTGRGMDLLTLGACVRVASYPGSKGRGKESLVSIACACT
jgi:hypothetical protein